VVLVSLAHGLSRGKMGGIFTAPTTLLPKWSFFSTLFH
jgi:hypothetical protein